MTGGDFRFNTVVKIHLDRESGAVLASALADEQSTFSVSVTIPSSTKAGKHELIAIGSDGRRAEVAITVT